MSLLDSPEAKKPQDKGQGREKEASSHFSFDVRQPGKLIIAYRSEIFCKSAPEDEDNRLVDQLDEADSSATREKLLALWRYLYALIDFSNFTTASLKDTRVNQLFNEFLWLSTQITFEVAKFGTNFQDIGYARFNKIDFSLVNEMMMDKLFKVFYTVFASEHMQSCHDCDLNKKFLVIKSRLLEVFILLCIRVKRFPFETTSSVIRELNRDPNILLHLIDENTSFEPSLFTMEYRNFLKTACLIPANLYTNKTRFISLYFPCFFYSLMGERLISKSGLFSSLLSQCLQAIKDEQKLYRTKAGTICATFFSVYSVAAFA